MVQLALYAEPQHHRDGSFSGANSAGCDVGEAVGLLGGQREPRPRRARPAGALRTRGQGLRKTPPTANNQNLKGPVCKILKEARYCRNVYSYI